MFFQKFIQICYPINTGILLDEGEVKSDGNGYWTDRDLMVQFGPLSALEVENGGGKCIQRIRARCNPSPPPIPRYGPDDHWSSWRDLTPWKYKNSWLQKLKLVEHGYVCGYCGDRGEMLSIATRGKYIISSYMSSCTDDVLLIVQAIDQATTF